MSFSKNMTYFAGVIKNLDKYRLSIDKDEL